MTIAQTVTVASCLIAFGFTLGWATTIIYIHHKENREIWRYK
jgi:hypothetical protein